MQRIFVLIKNSAVCVVEPPIVLELCKLLSCTLENKRNDSSVLHLSEMLCFTMSPKSFIYPTSHS